MYMKMTWFQRALAYLGIFFFFLIVILFGMKGNTIFSVNAVLGYDIFHSIQYYMVEKPSKLVMDFMKSYAIYDRTSHEVRLLEEEIHKIALVKEELKQVRKENSELKALLELEHTMSEYDRKTANVISRDESGWHNYLTIDLGSKDGIQVNQAVINQSGLIGKVYQVNEGYSVVKLITAEDGLSKVSLKIVQKEQIEAMLDRYDANLMAFEITALNANYEIEEGSQIVTSGLGGVFPNGILVGTVSEVIVANNRLGKIVYAKPAADFSDLSYVQVIQRKVQETHD